MTQKEQHGRKQIVVTPETYEGLRHLGSLTESFNDVITRLLEQNQSQTNNKKALAIPQVTTPNESPNTIARTRQPSVNSTRRQQHSHTTVVQAEPQLIGVLSSEQYR